MENTSSPAQAKPSMQQPNSGDTSAQASSGQAADTRDVLQLDPLPEELPTCEQSFDQEAAHPCTTRYGSIIYATDEQAFWLIPERVASLLKEAEHKLGQQIAPTKSPDERKKGLDESGLLEYFMEPVLANFLEGAQKERMLKIEAEEPHLEARYLQKRGYALMDPRMQTTPTWDEYQRLEPLYREWDSLRDSALQIAQSQGYTYENDHLFTPEAMEARKRVETYLKARDALLSQGELPVYSQDEIAKLLAEKKTRFEDAIDCAVNCRAKLATYMSWVDSNEQGIQYSEYLDAIIAVADYGLALPEFALVDSAAGAGVDSGVAAFKQYLSLEQRLLQVTQRISDKYNAWIEASGENTPAPAGLVDAESLKRSVLLAEKLSLKTLAEQNVASMQPRRHLIWQPDDFKPKPVERLVKTHFPLREVSFADGKSVLSHFSLKDMGDNFKADAAKILRESPSKLRSSVSGASSVAEGARTEFQEWLLSQGAKQLKDQAGNWFDAEGWFDIELFYQHLQAQHWQVAILDDAGTRVDWGERLRQVLFRQDARVALRLFNQSPQAQLIRCLTPPQPSIHSAASVATPNFTMADGFQAFASATLDIDLARGEVELLKVDIPERSAATDFKLAYVDYKGIKQELNLGRFSIHCSILAWGYAGASLMVAGSLRFGPDKSSHDLLLDPSQPGTRTPGTVNSTHVSQPVSSGSGGMRVDDGVKAQFNVFAGVQAGIKITGAVNWAPPADLAILRSAPLAGADANAVAQDNQWLSLARLGANLSIAAGIGAKAELSISLQNNRLILTIKAAVIAGPGVDGVFSFEVGYQAVAELINIFRRELRENQYRPLDWVTSDAFGMMSMLNLLAAVGLDIKMVYMMDMAFSLYEALTRGGKGGPIAQSIIEYENQEELRRWFVEAIPEALGPMLMTLISPPEAFSVTNTVIIDGQPESRTQDYSEVQCHLFQQQAIERVLGWITRQAQVTGKLAEAQRQFEEACTRMNRFGSKPADASQIYCENRLALDNFMAVAVVNIGSQATQNNEMRNRYKVHTMTLGALKDGFCQRSSYYGRTFIPAGRAEYIGPSQ